MRSNLQVCVLATLSYSDIFDYPLTQDQVHQFLVSKKVSLKGVKDCLKELLATEKIDQKGKFYFLPDREKIAEARIEREIISKEKLKIARKIARILGFIPSIKFVGVSGALACRNSKSQDDIDFFIITQAGQVWTTRFFSTLILDFLGKRRKPQDKEFKDKICLNLFLDESDLCLGPKDLFLAREIVQLEPLYNKDSCYSKFLSKNAWIKKFLPNAKTQLRIQEQDGKKGEKKFNILFIFAILEPVLRNLQLFYMRKRITCEKLSKTRIFFHPIDVHYKILAEYKKRIAQLPS
jgi:hypothetical protein